MTNDDIKQIIENQDFIIQNLEKEPAKLALKYSKEPEKKILISQIAWRQKLRKKVPEWYDNPNIVLPSQLATEQASSAQTARLKATLVKGKKLLDITGGLGIDSFYLSESFNSTTYVEQDVDLAKTAQINFKAFDKSIEVKNANGLAVLENSDADVIYVDPYRRTADKTVKVQSLAESTPDVTKIKHKLVENGRKSLIKTSPMFDLNQAIKELEFVKEIWVLSLRNDCKEVVYLLSADANNTGVLVRTFNETARGWQQFSGLKSDLRINCTLGDPARYLYEPNSAVLKANLQDELAESLKLKKLHSQSNIFTSQEMMESYPGKIFELTAVKKPFDKGFKKGRYNVIARNFRGKASEIEKKLKLKPHHSSYLIATQLLNGEYKFLEAQLLN